MFCTINKTPKQSAQITIQQRLKFGFCLTSNLRHNTKSSCQWINEKSGVVTTNEDLESYSDERAELEADVGGDDFRSEYWVSGCVVAWAEEKVEEGSWWLVVLSVESIGGGEFNFKGGFRWTLKQSIFFSDQNNQNGNFVRLFLINI